ncbi:MAG: M4 family metallopeptidase, partial [Longispora sp.]|nr:M4 family metallopeptidase [Longispora sp. (in: high G+C Gram-positive bacteria)]
MRRSIFVLGTLTVCSLTVATSPTMAQPDRTGGGKVEAAVGLLRSHADEAMADGDQTFAVRGIAEDPDGTSHIRLNRYYKELPVIGGDMIVHTGRGGAWRGVTQTLDETPKLSATPTLDAVAAGTRAVEESQADDKKVAGSKLVVYAGDGKPRLAYQVVVSGAQPDQTPSRLHVIVDANSAEVVDSWETIHTAGEGTGHGFHVGEVPLGSSPAESGSGHELVDASRGGAKTYDMAGATEGGGTLFNSTDNVFGDGKLDNPATAGADAHYGSMVTWDYYKKVHSRNGIRNDGKAAATRVHFGKNYVNAFWSDECFCMTYGDGNPAKGLHPLTSLDVAGHEMTHGVTAATAGLVYSGESGGLNEATSDIFGTLVEFHAANSADASDYMIGEKVREGGKPMRYMDKPSRDGKSVDCWDAKVGELDVHFWSG